MRSVLAGGVRGALLLLFMAAAAGDGGAQESYSRLEVGAHFTGIKLFDSLSTSSVKAGFGARFDFNLTRRVAVETQVDFYPESVFVRPRLQGGRTLVATAGIRGKILQTRRFALYGTIRPGLIHFTDTIQRFEGALLNPGPPPLIGIFARTGPETHFALDLGGGIEFYPSPRWIARVGVDEMLYRVQGGEFPLPTTSAFVSIPSQMQTTWRLNGGLGYRLGPLRQNEPESPAAGRLTLGAQFATLILARQIDALERESTEPGFGGFVSYRLARFLDADAALSFLPRDGPSSGPHDGGRILLGEFGVKAGVRRNRMGLFAKARPGLSSYSAAITGVNFTPSAVTFTFDRTTNFVLDVGGVVEVYPTRHTMLRFDASDVLFFYGTRRFVFGPTQTDLSGGPKRDSMQFSAGYGWRF